jgi:membrane-associated phospholipid phosphatase
MSQNNSNVNYKFHTGLDPVLNVTCPSLARREEYSLPGPQIEPDASFWTIYPCKVPCVIRISDLVQRTDNPDDDCYFPPYPDDPDVVEEEIEELVELASLRDDPSAVFSSRRGRERRAISPFLQYRPQPLSAIFNLERDPALSAIETGRRAEPDLIDIETGEILDTAFPVIRTGRELARWFENNTPGLAHRHALNYLLRDQNWSPPRQAWIWATLDITIYSALLAAWYYKWLADSEDAECNQRGAGPRPGSDGRRTSRRPRPFEFDSRVGVLYDREVNRRGDGDGERRLTPSPSPGTPRHPSYPSGHSTYGAAASELLAWFFPDYREELYRLADNTGLARLWGGIHYRSDHIQGMKLGRCVACMVIQDIIDSCIPRIPDCCPPNCPPYPPTPDAGCRQGAPPPAGPCDPPPTIEQLCERAKMQKHCCEGEGEYECPPVAEAEGAREDRKVESSGEIRERSRSPQQGSGGATRSTEKEREQSRSPQKGAQASGSSSKAERKRARSPQKGAR